VEISNISGTGFGGLPTFGNRQINTVLRLRDGETNLMAGLIRDNERNVLDGIPGLSDIPYVGRFFARSRKETQETDIVLTITPRIVRVLDLTEADLRPFRVGRDAGSGGGGIIDLPIVPPIPTPSPVPPPAPVPPAPPAGDTGQPLRPAAPVQPVQPPPIK
jgi:general secretion pathway protein D